MSDFHGNPKRPYSTYIFYGLELFWGLDLTQGMPLFMLSCEFQEGLSIMLQSSSVTLCT